jgi:hypothetical protein
MSVCLFLYYSKSPQNQNHKSFFIVSPIKIYGDLLLWDKLFYERDNNKKERGEDELTLKSQQQNAIFSLTWRPMARRAIKPDEMVKRLAVKKHYIYLINKTEGN